MDPSELHYKTFMDYHEVRILPTPQDFSSGK